MNYHWIPVQCLKVSFEMCVAHQRIFFFCMHKLVLWWTICIFWPCMMFPKTIRITANSHLQLKFGKFKKLLASRQMINVNALKTTADIGITHCYVVLLCRWLFLLTFWSLCKHCVLNLRVALVLSVKSGKGLAISQRLKLWTAQTW